MTTTRLYCIPRERRWGAWARIWITDDGCFTTISDYGNYGYWWSDFGPADFRKFLIDCEPGYYITTKLAGGKREFRGDGTAHNIAEYICRTRRDKECTRRQARREWDLLKEYREYDSELEWKGWYDRTQLPDAADLLRYDSPMQLQMFMKEIWPRFVEQLKAEIGGANVLERESVGQAAPQAEP